MLRMAFLNINCTLCLMSKLEGIFGIVLIGCERCNGKPTQACLYAFQCDRNYPVDKMQINTILPFILKGKSSFKLGSELSTEKECFVLFF